MEYVILFRNILRIRPSYLGNSLYRHQKYRQFLVCENISFVIIYMGLQLWSGKKTFSYDKISYFFDFRQIKSLINILWKQVSICQIIPYIFEMFYIEFRLVHWNRFTGLKWKSLHRRSKDSLYTSIFVVMEVDLLVETVSNSHTIYLL